MEKIIGPRASGKTTKAIEYVAKEEHRVLVCPTHHMARFAERLAKEKGFEHIRCISFDTFLEYRRNRPTDNKYEFVIDELDACLEMAKVIAYTNEDDEGEHRHGLYDYASRELEKAFPDKNDTMQQAAIKDILELIKVFSEQGHSSFSGLYALRYFDRLVQFKPIGPLTGEEDEWGEPDNSTRHTQQNKRCPSVFRDNFDNSTARDIEARVFADKDGHCWTSKDSVLNITFPYKVPDKPEIIKE